MVSGSGHCQELIEGFPTGFRNQKIAHPGDCGHRGLMTGTAQFLVRHNLRGPFAAGFVENPDLFGVGMVRILLHGLIVQIDQALRALGRIGPERIESGVERAFQGIVHLDRLGKGVFVGNRRGRGSFRRRSLRFRLPRLCLNRLRRFGGRSVGGRLIWLDLDDGRFRSLGRSLVGIELLQEVSTSC